MYWACTPTPPSKSLWLLLSITTGGCMRKGQPLGWNEVEPPTKFNILLFVIHPIHWWALLLSCVPEFLLHLGHWTLSSGAHFIIKTSLWIRFTCDGHCSCHHVSIVMSTECSFQQHPLFLWASLRHLVMTCGSAQITLSDTLGLDILCYN